MNIFIAGYAAHELGIFNQKHEAIRFIRQAFYKKVVPLIEDGAEWFIITGTYGFDLWAAEVLFMLRKTEYPHIKVSMIQAFQNQEENWKDDRKAYFNKIKSKLDHFAVVSQQPYAGPWQFQARDQLILQKTDAMILFYDEESAESKAKFIKEKAIKRAELSDYPIITIIADDIQAIMDEDALMRMGEDY